MVNECSGKTTTEAQRTQRLHREIRIGHSREARYLVLRASRAIIGGFRLAQIFVCMPEEAIQVKGARVNNLKNVSFSVPINQMTVVTGVSGSGKSSLAFDTIYAEGQRRYVESLSAYARQFLERMDKPDVDEI